MNENLPTEKLLKYIKQRFYDPYPHKQRYFQDRRMLLYALTWPAAWLEERALHISAQRYETLLRQRLQSIERHGDPARYLQYFPRYLLKTIQDWFAWHGDDLYDQLKHIRNHLPDIEAILRSRTPQPTESVVSPMARAHALLAVHYRRKKQPEPKQLTLF